MARDGGVVGGKRDGERDGKRSVDCRTGQHLDVALELSYMENSMIDRKKAIEAEQHCEVHRLGIALSLGTTTDSVGTGCMTR